MSCQPDVYWDSAYRPDRERLLDGVARFWPFDCVLELGCNSGPVRRRLRERFGPAFIYHGLDNNEAALAQARAFGADDGNAYFHGADLRTALGLFADKSMDVVVSSSVLQCLPHDEWIIALDHARRIAAKGVVVVEDYGHGEQIPGRGWAYHYPDWIITC